MVYILMTLHLTDDATIDSAEHFIPSIYERIRIHSDALPNTLTSQLESIPRII